MAGWAVAMTRHPGPLGIDRRVFAALALDTRWRDAGLRLSRPEGPVTLAVAAVLVASLAAAAVLLCRPAGPIGRRLTRPGALTLSIGVVIVGVADIAVIAVAAIATGGHLFSDVVAVVPWAVALPVASHDLLAAPTPDTARRH